MKLYVMASNGYLPTLVFSPEQGFNRVLKGRGTVVATGRVEQGMIKVGEEIEIMGLMQVSFFSDEEETTSRPKADALFIPRENLSALVIRPLETWPGNASVDKPKGEYTEFASTSHQNGRHTDNGNALMPMSKSFRKRLQGTTEFDDVKGIRMATMKEVPPTAYEVDAMKKHDINRFVLDTYRHLKEKKSYQVAFDLLRDALSVIFGLSELKLPPKETDPGSFVLPCIIGNTMVSNALADLGASISVMPFSMFKRLGLGNPRPINMVIEMVDRSMQSPKGIVENVLAKIHKFIFSVDFVILDIVDDNKVPIIPGRPMLATAHARIDVFRGKISLEIGK
ncbi:retrovirus-related pol polyprotein from transposon TNT 1-94 [Tanacetum coccineum]